jgi:Lon protease-like protein
VLVDDEDGSTYSIGTTARITNVTEFPDGRMDILVVGTERFIVDKVRVHRDEYLIGDAMMYPFTDAVKPSRDLQNAVSSRLKDYLKIVAQVGGVEFRYDAFPKESAGIAVFAAIALQLPLDDKQELLATESVGELLSKEERILKDELFTLRLMSGATKPPKQDDAYAFSSN